jgi:RNA polymerase sigma-70 factor (ECF subfamily)
MVAAGNHRALGRMTRCYRDRLVEVGLRHCPSAALAEDAVQDALLSAGDALGSFRGECSLEGWLTRIVINRCRRMRRGRKNDPRLHTTEEALETAETAGDSCPERQAFQAELREALEHALSKLSAENRAIVILSDALGWKSHEIANRLDMTPGSVRTRLHRLHAALRVELTEVHS